MLSNAAKNSFLPIYPLAFRYFDVSCTIKQYEPVVRHMATLLAKEYTVDVIQSEGRLNPTSICQEKEWTWKWQKLNKPTEEGATRSVSTILHPVSFSQLLRPPWCLRIMSQHSMSAKGFPFWWVEVQDSLSDTYLGFVSQPGSRPFLE